MSETEPVLRTERTYRRARIVTDRTELSRLRQLPPPKRPRRKLRQAKFIQRTREDVIRSTDPPIDTDLSSNRPYLPLCDIIRRGKMPAIVFQHGRVLRIENYEDNQVILGSDFSELPAVRY